MNRFLIYSIVAILFLGCSDFEQINTDPKAMNMDQAQPELFLNNSITEAQQDPNIAERIFVLYWKTAARHQRANGLTTGSYNDGWSSEYYGIYMSKWISTAGEAIKIAQYQIDNNKAQLYTNNILQIARIWKAYLISEASDMFGPFAIPTQDNIVQFASQKDVYYYLLSELQDAQAKLEVSRAEKPEGKFDKFFEFNYAAWQKYANSLRLRLAIRMSEVDPGKAKSEFESVDLTKVILTSGDFAQVAEMGGWDPLTGVMTREWNSQQLSATLNNLYVGLGGIETANQLPSVITGTSIGDVTLSTYIKDEDWLGVKYEQQYTTKTNDPAAGYFFDGLPNKIDPRAYKTFIIPGWFSNADFCNYPSWNEDAKTTKRPLLKVAEPVSATDSIIIEATMTWNAGANGDWGDKGALNFLYGFNGTNPTLALRYRNGSNKRIFFASWEVYFLIAEPALRGWTTTGYTAQEAYENGIKASFAYTQAKLGTYLESEDYNRCGTSVRWLHTVEPTQKTMRYKKPDESIQSVIYNYPENSVYGSNKNDQLTKIITQKYIAQVPWLPLEGWNEQRRLGLPFFENPAVEKPITNLPALTDATYMNSAFSHFPQRVPYPASLKISNAEHYNKAVELLGGSDQVLTPLWWAKK